MSLNIANVTQQTGISPMGMYLMGDFGQSSSLPKDVTHIIFKNLKAELPVVAQVSKNWRGMADDKEFRKLIRPSQANGTQEWKEYLGVVVEEESLLPRRAYGDLENEDRDLKDEKDIGWCVLTFIPKNFRVTDDKGVIKEINLENLIAFTDLAKHPKKGNSLVYSNSTWKEAIEEKRTLQNSHWVWIKGGGGIQGSERKRKVLIEEENKKAFGAHISGFIDTIIGVSMEYIRSKKRHFWNWEYVTVKEKTRGMETIVGFDGPDELDIMNTNIKKPVPGCSTVHVARKSF